MVGSGLKKLAKEKGMQVAGGVAYGMLDGYAATMSEGAGYKQILFSTTFPRERQRGELVEFTGRMNLARRYRVQSLSIEPRRIHVVFLDNPGTMKKIREFLEWFLPLLPIHGATAGNICPECGGEITDGCWLLVEGMARYCHETCAGHIRQQIDQENARTAEEATGSYGLGLVGALLGAALGAAVWAVVLNLGYVASVVGLLIGWLAEKGYNLLHGRQGKGKVAILIAAILFGVLFGTLLADAFTLTSMILGGELPGFILADIPQLIATLLAQDAEYRVAVLGNILTGFLFAGLGVFALLRKAGKEVADVKYAKLP